MSNLCTRRHPCGTFRRSARVARRCFVKRFWQRFCGELANGVHIRGKWRTASARRSGLSSLHEIYSFIYFRDIFSNTNKQYQVRFVS